MKAFFRLMLSDMRKLFNIKTVLISAAAFILAVAVLARNGAGDSFVIYITGGFLPEEQDNLQQFVAALAEYTGLTACIGYITQTDNARRMQVLMRCRNSARLYCANTAQSGVLCALWSTAGFIVTLVCCVIKNCLTADAVITAASGAGLQLFAGCALAQLILALNCASLRVEAVCAISIITVLLQLCFGGAAPWLPIAAASLRRINAGTASAGLCIGVNFGAWAALYISGLLLSVKRAGAR